jgi:hypothetical protein
MIQIRTNTVYEIIGDPEPRSRKDIDLKKQGAAVAQ